MKRLLAFGFAGLLCAGAGAAFNEPQRTAAQLLPSVSSTDPFTIEAENRKGSKRVGGKNSKGKGSTYRGGLKK